MSNVNSIDDLNEEKKLALKAIASWHNNCVSDKGVLGLGKMKKPFFYLAGYAGTGKTTLIKFLSKNFPKLSIGYATYTGKAASILEEKGIFNPSTIHSLIYSVQYDEDTGKLYFTLNEDSDIKNYDLMVLDEVSMLNEEIGKDISSFGIPLLVVGDEGQLPPIKGTGYFTAGNPDFNLEEIHRQALKSGIIRLSVDVRLNFESFSFKNYIGKYDDVEITNLRNITDEQLANFDLVAVGMHKTRRNIIKRVRRFKGEGAYPQAGSKIVITKNNKHSGLMNGHIKDVIAVKETSSERLIEHIQMEIRELLDNGKDNVAIQRQRALELIRKHPELDKRFLNVKIEIDSTPKWVVVYLGEFFEDATGKSVKDSMPKFKETNQLIQMLGAEIACYAYALTVHKLQGSQGDNLLFIDDGFASSFDLMLRKRWLYTGITRAAKYLTIAI